MSRGLRVFSESGIYHIVFRGVNKQNIFMEKFDYVVMLNYIKEIKLSCPFELYAYCFMSNHVHLLIKEKNIGEISQIMKKILVKYALYFNNKYDRCGHLFESRYKSKPVDSDDYLFASLRYIHQNPVKATLVEKLDEYQWSSYNEYLKNIDGLIDKQFIMSIINLKQFKRMHLAITDDFDPFDKKSWIINEIKKEIINNFKIRPEEVINLYGNQKRMIFSSLLLKYSCADISKATGISFSSILYYKQ